MVVSRRTAYLASSSRRAIVIAQRARPVRLRVRAQRPGEPAPVFVPPSLYAEAMRRGVDVTGFAPMSLMPAA